MKWNLLFLLLIGAWGLQGQELRIQVEGVNPSGGNLQIGLYRPTDGFPVSESVFIGVEIEVGDSKTLQYSFQDLPAGIYGVAIYQDLNNNQKLDKGVFGIPAEPYGFSGSQSTLWRKPTFDQVAFEYFGRTQTITVKLQKWGD
ncbi:MAG: DUF2141 domain-containing protein [Saprospiraceae bacterium]|nr:DUF2141 domain-containing protein [Saprospiraceae bacterium]